ncbi:hypothetical protein GUITHDRAFT_118092 [Guillardia theta CCMP2712]|uniref:Uncharacterized protein n=1 Tax=Guillardia theta (strain CCMP2712) TaxID=905079 RepID=L1IHX5_GUITC|nr:hypothetical protein GUITHDRAFT_118092 [Guillardia theta CCMP2712]EKX35707.1 hypothetical protein GUITHDRAFT_118092 [Guillardia theta CCMP2712]|eukprot:XP_005822687.1 hypothetical protein GUITHDRAFT_118092 [Guillardia theta CCMP2712]
MVSVSYGTISRAALKQLPYQSKTLSLRKKVVLGLAVVACVAVGALISTSRSSSSTSLMGTWTKPTGIGIDREPYSAPMNLWLYWGRMTNKRFTGSGEHVRHVFQMGTIAGGEWRDPKFLRSLEGGMFNKLSGICCNALLFPPIEWDFLVVNPQKIVGQNIRQFVANGNTMIFTGGILSLEFINRYFSYQLEPADGNLDPGPFVRLPHFQGLTQEQHDLLVKGSKENLPSPRTLPQIGIEVTSIKKDSLPSGTSVIYSSPYNSAVVAIKFCMAENPANDPAAPLPPVKVLPRDCPVTAAQGRPCSCGFICYLGYNWRDAYPSRWDTALKGMVDVCSQVPPENNSPSLLASLNDGPMAEPEKSEKEAEDSIAAQESIMKQKLHPQALKNEEEKEQEKVKEEEKVKEKEAEEKASKEEEEKAEGTEEKAVERPDEEDEKSAKLKMYREDHNQRDAEDVRERRTSNRDGCGPLCKLENLVDNLEDKKYQQDQDQDQDQDQEKDQEKEEREQEQEKEKERQGRGEDRDGAISAQEDRSLPISSPRHHGPANVSSSMPMYHDAFITTTITITTITITTATTTFTIVIINNTVNTSITIITMTMTITVTNILAELESLRQDKSCDPYLDYPIPIGKDATISEPWVHSLSLELLSSRLFPGARALDVGSGR